MSNKPWVVNSDSSLEYYIEHVRELYAEHKYATFKESVAKQRTNTQNAALHVYFTLLANALNDAGYDLRRFFELRPQLDISWDAELVKKELWKPIQEVMLNKESTTEPNTAEYDKVYNVLNRFTAQEFGISILWPCKDNKDGQ